MDAINLHKMCFWLEFTNLLKNSLAWVLGVSQSDLAAHHACTTPGGTLTKKTRQYRHLFKNSALLQSSSGPISGLCSRFIQETDFSVWFMNPWWRAPSRLRLVSIGMQNIYYHCLSTRHTVLCACPFACSCGREVWLAVFSYCKYLSHSHSCCWDPVLAPLCCHG